MLGHIGGLRPAVLNETTLRFARGSVADLTTGDVETFADDYDIDTTKTGMGGLDQLALVSGQDYFPYVIKHQNGTLGMVLSASITLGGVVLPANCSLVRKLPFGICAAPLPNGVVGLPPVHISHWPMPAITYTDPSHPWFQAIVDGGAATAWTAISLEKWVPDNARLAWVHCEVAAPSRAGTAYLRVLGSANGMAIGNGNPASGVRALGLIPIPLTSTRQIYYRVIGGAVLQALRVVRYEMTEPTT